MVNETNVEMLHSVKPKLYKRQKIRPNNPNEEIIDTELPDDDDISHTEVAEHIENENVEMIDSKPKRQRKSTLDVTKFDHESTPRQTRSKRKISNTTPENRQGSTSSKVTENLVNHSKTRSGANSVLPPSLDVSSQSTEIIVPIGTKTNTDELVSDRNIPSPEILLPDNKLITSRLPIPEKGNNSDSSAGENILTDLEHGASSSGTYRNTDNESTASNRTDATDTVTPPAREIRKGVDPTEKQGKFRDFSKMSNSDLTEISTCMNPGTERQMAPDQNHKLSKLVKMTSGISSGTRNTAPENSQSWKYFNILHEKSKFRSKKEMLVNKNEKF